VLIISHYIAVHCCCSEGNVSFVNVVKLGLVAWSHAPLVAWSHGRMRRLLPATGRHCGAITHPSKPLPGHSCGVSSSCTLLPARSTCTCCAAPRHPCTNRTTSLEMHNGLNVVYLWSKRDGAHVQQCGRS
jgi:hypothetical protein